MKPEQDSSLQAASLKRSRSKEAPTTLTPYEWLEWYQRYGQPASHRASGPRPRRLWYRLFNRPERNRAKDKPARS